MLGLRFSPLQFNLIISFGPALPILLMVLSFGIGTDELEVLYTVKVIGYVSLILLFIIALVIGFAREGIVKHLVPLFILVPSVVSTLFLWLNKS